MKYFILIVILFNPISNFNNRKLKYGNYGNYDYNPNYKKETPNYIKEFYFNDDNKYKDPDNKSKTNDVKDFINSLNIDPKDKENDDLKLINKLATEVFVKDLDIKFEDIIGSDQAKTAINESIILPLKMKKYFSKLRAPSGGILFYGPPGTGKTMLAKAVASYGKLSFFNVSPSIIGSKWVGESEKLVSYLFKMARFYAPSVIFMDELDALLSKRGSSSSESSTKIKSQFLAEMDGVGSTSDKQKVIVIGATNLPWNLDEAFKRRFSKRIYIDLPNADARAKLFKLYLKDISISASIDYNKLAGKTEGYNAGDIKNVCRDAAMAPLNKKIKLQKFKDNEELIASMTKLETSLLNDEILMSDIEASLKVIKKSSSNEYCEQYKKWNDEFGTA